MTRWLSSFDRNVPIEGCPAYSQHFTGFLRPGPYLLWEIPILRGGREVPRRGLEPLCLAAPDPKSGASANFATSAAQGHPCGLTRYGAFGSATQPESVRTPHSRTRPTWFSLSRQAIATPTHNDSCPGPSFSSSGHSHPPTSVPIRAAVPDGRSKPCSCFPRTAFPKGRLVHAPVPVGPRPGCWTRPDPLKGRTTPIPRP